MKKEAIKFSISLSGLFVLTIAFFYWFVRSPYYAPIDLWAEGNRTLFILLLFGIKTAGIVWPPIPGGLFTLGAVPFLGWEIALLIDIAGSLAGGTIGYFLGRKYGMKVIKKLFNERVVGAILKLKIKKGKEVEAVFMYKSLFGIFAEALYYAAGLLKVNFWKFTLGITLSEIFPGAPWFYLTQNILEGKNTSLALVLVALAIFIAIKTRGRYFE